MLVHGNGRFYQLIGKINEVLRQSGETGISLRFGIVWAGIDLTRVSTLPVLSMRRRGTAKAYSDVWLYLGVIDKP